MSLDHPMNATTILHEIGDFCREAKLAESTFGRLAVNDGKLVSRLRDGASITTATLDRLRAYIEEHRPRPNGATAGAPAPARDPGPNGATAPDDAGRRNFRFFDNRQKYLLFVNTCSEKWAVANRVAQEFANIKPRPPALRLFDAGVGDGTVLTRVMRSMHARFPTMPFYIVGKEISLEDIRLTLEKVADRFFEHPASVLVLTNLYYSEAPWLTPRSSVAARSLVWKDLALSGNSSHEFEEQITALQPFLSENWNAGVSPKSGNPVYERPVVLTIHRQDQGFLLDAVLPRPGRVSADYDLIIASQPYRARASAQFKAQKVIAPLARALGPGGRLLGMHSCGDDPGMEIIHAIWPDEQPFTTDRHAILKATKHELGADGRRLNFNAYSDERSLFRYHMHTLPNEVSGSIGTSTLFAAWNAAIYVAQIEEQRLSEVVRTPDYLQATDDVLRRHGGLWFKDETYAISRRPD
jgi:SAM-dependent methyltransferase